MDSTTSSTQAQGAPPTLADQVARQCVAMLAPLLVQLDTILDVRLVRTLAASVLAVVRHRHRSLALLLSELGAVLAGPEHAPAGTKRLARLLHSDRWGAEAIDAYLLERGRARVVAEAAWAKEGRALCILDGSVLEKPESARLEGLRPVRSSKARRLTRPRPTQGAGYYRGRPGPPIVVPGFGWLGVLVTGWAGREERRPLTLGAWHWYAPLSAALAEARGSLPEFPGLPRQTLEEAEQAVLLQVVRAWGSERLLHVWDRGFASASWLGWSLGQGWHFVVRWKKGNRLRPVEASGAVSQASPAPGEGAVAWKLDRGQRPWGRGSVPDPRHPQRPVTVAYLAQEVRLLHDDAHRLWLVTARMGKRGGRRGGREPWRLLTTEPVETPEQCWRVVQAYAARWQVEQMLRYGKSELGLESVRVRQAEVRRKLWGVAGLAYAFLVELLGDSTGALLAALLRFAHRTGRQASAWRPLYRLRAALAALWHYHTPNLPGFFP